MAVTGVSNLAEFISNQSLNQGQETSRATTPPVQQQAAAAAAPTEDSFTPSTQNNSAQATAQAAGLFEVSESALVSATANILSIQTAQISAAPAAQTARNVPFAAVAPASNVQAPTPAPATPTATAAQVTTSAADAPAPAPAPAAAAPQATSNAAAVAPVAATTNTPAPVPAAPTPQIPIPPTSSATTQGELQSLNGELSALGLSNGDIQDIDRIANATNNYNPTAYNDLVQQFETQAPQTAPATAIPAGGNHTTPANNPAA